MRAFETTYFNTNDNAINFIFVDFYKKDNLYDFVGVEYDDLEYKIKSKYPNTIGKWNIIKKV